MAETLLDGPRLAWSRVVGSDGFERKKPLTWRDLGGVRSVGTGKTMGTIVMMLEPRRLGEGVSSVKGLSDAQA